MDRIFSAIGCDGCKHIIISAVLTVVAKWLLPVWVAVAAVLSVGVAKEIYDKSSGKGSAEWKDIACDVVGVIIGIL